MKILFVRLGSLGDIIHTVPAVAAVRGALPRASIHWLVDTRQLDVLELVEGVDKIHPLRSDPAGWVSALGALRRERFDAALDFQGLLKSAVLARLARARRTIGFSNEALREPVAAAFYNAFHKPPAGVHVITMNLSLLAAINIHQPAAPTFRFASRPSAALTMVERQTGGRFALVNPGAAWSNKRWPADRLGAVAAAIARDHSMPSIVIWGPGERDLAERVAAASNGAATTAPATSVADLFALSRRAALMLSGDTGPLHIAAAVGTPVVGLFGPTDPRRNGPWSSSDVSVSRFERCVCHHRRRCTGTAWCLEDIQVPEVLEAVGRRLGRVSAG